MDLIDNDKLNIFPYMPSMQSPPPSPPMQPEFTRMMAYSQEQFDLMRNFIDNLQSENKRIIDYIEIVEQKCNQLQIKVSESEGKIRELQMDLLNLATENDISFNNIRRSMQQQQQKNQQQQQQQQQRNQQQHQQQKQKCLLDLRNECFYISNYPVDRIGSLIGVNGYNIKEIQNMYNIYIQIPKQEKQFTDPIRIYANGDNDTTNVLQGVEHVIDILTNNKQKMKNNNHHNRRRRHHRSC